MMMKFFLAAGSISGALAVILGAFGAHALKARLEPHLFEIFEKGIQYHFYHTFALFIVAILFQFRGSQCLTYSGIAFIVGIILFSFSLYVYALTGNKAFAIITPFGGVGFIVGWVSLLVYSLGK
jgi:uncharacterized membrane protein YgdD (TMEM256/DUF423 family)